MEYSFYFAATHFKYLVTHHPANSTTPEVTSSPRNVNSLFASGILVGVLMLCENMKFAALW